jgi:hypothetical protein
MKKVKSFLHWNGLMSTTKTVDYNVADILEKSVIDAFDIAAIFYNQLYLRRKEAFPGLSLVDFSRIFDLGEKSIRNLTPSTLERVGEKTAVKMARGTVDSTCCTLLGEDEQRIYRRYLNQYRDKFKDKRGRKTSGEDEIVEDRELLINEFVTKYTNSRDLIELLCHLFSHDGLRKSFSLTPVQQLALKELLAFEYAYETGWETFKINSKYSTQFKLHPSLVNTMWDLGLEKAEAYMRRNHVVINSISQDEILPEDIARVEESLIKSKKVFDEAVKKASENLNKERVQVIYGRLFSGFVHPLPRIKTDDSSEPT